MTASVGAERLDAVSAPKPDAWTLNNGLRVLHLPVRHASLVSTVLCYRAGTSVEEPTQAGIAHFLEHLMFKGSERYGGGEIDRVTQRLGGWNNAFTSHDSAVYYFGFSADCWREAVAIEADRMKALNLDERDVDSERSVIEEEIAMYWDDPWDALELEVHAQLFGSHPYGRPILGTRESLAVVDSRALRAFHQRYYGPENAVLAVAGDVSRSAVEEATSRHFGGIPSRGGSRAVRALAAKVPSTSRLERRKGDTARLLLAMPGPAPDESAHAALILLLSVLANGRLSRLHQRLVEELEVCTRVAGDISETVGCSVLSISAEAMPGAAADTIEAEIREQLMKLAESPPTAEELDRARSLLAADWVFGRERIHQRGVQAAIAEALFDSDFPARQLRLLSHCDRDELLTVARSYLLSERGSVTGWSQPVSAN